MKHILAAIILSSATSGYAQTLLRTAEIQPVLGSGVKYKVEIQIDKQQLASEVSVKNRLETIEDNEMRAFEPEYKCISEVQLKKDLEITYVLKNTRGIIIGYAKQAPALSAQRIVDVDSVKAVCPTQFSQGEVISVLHPDEFVDFKILGSGQNLKLSVSANFTADIKVNGDVAEVSVNEKSLKQVRWFSDKEGELNGGRVDLIDPLNPPKPEEPIDYDRL